MSWSFVLQTVIYYSFSLIDVYELKHKMILKCTLIEAAVDSVTRGLTQPRQLAVHESLPASPRSGRRPGRQRPRSSWAGAGEGGRFIFIGGEGEGPSRRAARGPRAFPVFGIPAPAALAGGSRLPNYFIILKTL